MSMPFSPTTAVLATTLDMVRLFLILYGRMCLRYEPATSSERCLSSKSLLPVSLTASTLASKQTVFHLSRERTDDKFSLVRWFRFKMDKLDFTQRLYSVGQEPFPNKSIAYYSDDSKLFPALKEALEADEWEELKNSRVGVFLKFHEMKFGWASRLVHYILYFQLNCKKKFELWSLVGVEPLRFSLHEFEEITGLNCEYVKNLENPLVEVTTDMKAFWAQMGVNFDRGPSIDELTTACQMCRTWSRDDRLRLGYLAIYAGFIEAARTSPPTRASLTRLVMDLDAFEDYPWGRVAFKFLMESVKGVDLTKTYAIEGFVQVLQVWVYCCLPEFGAGFGHPIEGSPTPPLLAFLGGKGKRRLQENMLKQTRTKNFTMKDYSEMFPRWDGELEDEKADNIVKAVFSSGWAWEQSHWPLVGTKLWTNVKVEILPMKTEAGQMVRSLKTVSPSRTQSDAESRKKARESPGLDVETMKGEIVRWLTGLTSNMVEGQSRCENTLKTQSRMIEGLTTQVGAVEKMVREGWKEDHTKADSSTDVPEANKSDGDKAKKDSAEESKGDESDESKGEESKGEESRAEESKAAETAPKGMTTRAKARDTQATVSESENENGGISVVVVDKEQSCIEYGSVKKLKQVGKVRAARIVARAKSERQRRLAATQQSPFDGNNTEKVIIPNQPKQGQGYNPFANPDRQKLSALLDWVKLDPKWRQKVKGSSSHWFYILLTPTKWSIDTHMDAGINLLRLRYTKHPEWFRSDRFCILDAVFTQMWTAKYSEFLASPANPDGSGKLLPPGALDYYTGEEPAYNRSNKTWALEIDDIYVPLLVKNDHWVACWISIPRRRIVIWDSYLAYATDAEIAKAVKPIAHMLPYMLRMLSTGAERELYTVDFTHERESGVPQNKQSGDCGVYCLKYIECHALDMPFPPHELCDKKIKTIRSQMASEIFDETRINGTEKRDYKHLGLYD
ncbi:uncharacterized protein LOC106404172 [Brassica napus]|uniref:uncharacterized protein LOC106404172 n=1 Tax=Brassica napus TaxID=3708 RepID=UPI00207A434A|nr:uncharacterized protein LOC106404172 [Brassica napus]